MKSHYIVEHFFHPSLRPYLGVALACLRGASAYALVQSARYMHAGMPAALARLKVEVVPFLEAFATAWSFSAWSWVLIGAGIMFGIGLFTRTAASIFLVFLVGGAIIDPHAFIACMGSWTPVGLTVIVVALFSRWGYVWGMDEVLRRLGIGAKKNQRSW